MLKHLLLETWPVSSNDQAIENAIAGEPLKDYIYTNLNATKVS